MPTEKILLRHFRTTPTTYKTHPNRHIKHVKTFSSEMFLKGLVNFLKYLGTSLKRSGNFLKCLGTFLKKSENFLKCLGTFLKRPGNFRKCLRTFLKQSGNYCIPPALSPFQIREIAHSTMNMTRLLIRPKA